MENIEKINLLLPFVKPFGLTNGASVRVTVGIILVRIVINCFNFYFLMIDFLGSFGWAG